MSAKSTPAGLKGFVDFEGGLDDLAVAAESVLEAVGAGAAEGAGSINPRLIRDYAYKDILSRPEKSGKEAVYKYQHLVQLVAARILLGDGWPLSKVSEYVRNTKLEDLVTLADSHDRAKSAMAAIRDIRQRTGKQSARKPSALDAASLRQWREVTDRQARLAELRSDLPLLMSRIDGAYTRPETGGYQSVSLAEDLHFLIGDERLKALTLEEAEAIGRAVTSSLIQLRAKGGKP